MTRRRAAQAGPPWHKTVLCGILYVGGKGGPARAAGGILTRNKPRGPNVTGRSFENADGRARGTARERFEGGDARRGHGSARRDPLPARRAQECADRPSAGE